MDYTQDYTESSDYFCVRCLVGGDEKAFVELYRKYNRKIFQSCLKLTGSEALAEDITQDVFLKVWERRETIDPNQNFAAFIHTICRNAVFDIFKRGTREEEVKQKLQQFSHWQEGDEEDEDFYAEYQRLLEEAIAKLPPQRNIIFTRCKLQGESYKEVAESLGILSSTVQDSIVKANKSIRDYLSTHGNFSFAILYALLVQISES